MKADDYLEIQHRARLVRAREVQIFCNDVLERVRREFPEMYSTSAVSQFRAYSDSNIRKIKRLEEVYK
ncbi:hypothetical protein EPN42_06610 [bacterium]|nr:MAG: hypothetical protein EPN42_06610 [bacterium]